MHFRVIVLLRATAAIDTGAPSEFSALSISPISADFPSFAEFSALPRLVRTLRTPPELNRSSHRNAPGSFIGAFDRQSARPPRKLGLLDVVISPVVSNIGIFRAFTLPLSFLLPLRERHVPVGFISTVLLFAFIRPGGYALTYPRSNRRRANAHQNCLNYPHKNLPAFGLFQELVALGVQHDNGWRIKSVLRLDAGHLRGVFSTFRPRWPVTPPFIHTAPQRRTHSDPFTGIRRSHQGERLTAFARWDSVLL
jgi:hypothetical protein